MGLPLIEPKLARKHKIAIFLKQNLVTLIEISMCRCTVSSDDLALLAGNWLVGIYPN